MSPHQDNDHDDGHEKPEPGQKAVFLQQPGQQPGPQTGLQSGTDPACKSAKQMRAERLAAELRANLKRRKSSQRLRQTDSDGSDPDTSGQNGG